MKKCIIGNAQHSIAQHSTEVEPDLFRCTTHSIAGSTDRRNQTNVGVGHLPAFTFRSSQRTKTSARIAVKKVDFGWAPDLCRKLRRVVR